MNDLVKRRQRAMGGGLIARGNIDLSKRPVVKNLDGSISTIKSKSFGFEDGYQTLLPTISPDGKLLNDAQAVDLYRKTGKHLGKFRDVTSATGFAKKMSAEQGRRYGK